MGGDEVLALVISIAGAVYTIYCWYVPLFTATSLGGGRRNRFVLAIAPLPSLAILYQVLIAWSAPEVKNDWKYVALFMILGVAWIGLACAGAALAGISFAHDAVDGRNAAACATICGAVTGATLCYAG